MMFEIDHIAIHLGGRINMKITRYESIFNVDLLLEFSSSIFSSTWLLCVQNDFDNHT